MTYVVKEIFVTVQGEGAHAGRAAVFCRFAGCNLWSGRDEDRATATCPFCDTDFVGGKKFESAGELAAAIRAAWGDGRPCRFVVFTGGEPLLQLDDALIAAVHACGFAVAVETNGTLPAPGKIQWLCVSPKAGAPLVQSEADEFKVVFPQDGLDPEELRERVSATRFSIQPMDGPDAAANTAAAVAYVVAHPWWRLSLQTHKFAGIP